MERSPFLADDFQHVALNILPQRRKIEAVWSWVCGLLSPFAQANYHGCVHALCMRECVQVGLHTAGCTWRPWSFQRLQFIRVLPAAANSTQHSAAKLLSRARLCKSIISSPAAQTCCHTAQIYTDVPCILPTELCERAIGNAPFCTIFPPGNTERPIFVSHKTKLPIFGAEFTPFYSAQSFAACANFCVAFTRL